MKAARLRPRAETDLVERSHWYAEQGSEALGTRFFEEARQSLGILERDPGLGSKRLGDLAGVEGLRSWPLSHFPARWFYFERVDHLDVVRLLGERQDVAAILRAGLD